MIVWLKCAVIVSPCRCLIDAGRCFIDDKEVRGSGTDQVARPGTATRGQAGLHAAILSRLFRDYSGSPSLAGAGCRDPSRSPSHLLVRECVPAEADLRSTHDHIRTRPIGTASVGTTPAPVRR